MMLLLQQCCKAVVSAFSSGHTTDVSSVSERVTHHTTSSSWLIFLHPRLTFHVLCIYLVGAEWCSGGSWPTVSLETGSHQKGSPQKETGWTALVYRLHWPLLLEDSAESLQPPAQGTLESTHVGAWVGRTSETNDEFLVQPQPLQCQIQSATTAKGHLEYPGPPLTGWTVQPSLH